MFTCEARASKLSRKLGWCGWAEHTRNPEAGGIFFIRNRILRNGHPKNCRLGGYLGDFGSVFGSVGAALKLEAGGA